MATHLINNNATHLFQRKPTYEPPRTEVLTLVPFGILASSALTGLTNTESFEMGDIITFP